MFLMSSILFGALAVIIPVIIHLLQRQKPVPIRWGAMQFLLETPLKAKRRQNIDHWLLMLLRMAILALLAILLARPLWRGTRMAGTVNMDVAVVLDHSLSMGRRGVEGGGTLYENGLDVVDKLTEMLPASATVSVVLAEHTPQVVTPLPVTLGDASGKPNANPEWLRLRQQLRHMRPGMTDADIPAALQAARELVQHGKNVSKMILVLSDEQRSNWQIGNAGAWRMALGDRNETAAQDLPIFSLPLAQSGGGPNIAVRAVNIAPEFIGINRPVQITATLTNTGAVDFPAAPVKLIVDGLEIAQQQVANLPAGQSLTIHFDHFFAQPGSHWVKVQADVIDALEADNSMLAAVDVWPKLEALIVDGQLTPAAGPADFRDAQFLLAAMNPAEVTTDSATLISPRVVSVSDIGSIPLENYPLIVLHDVPRVPAETIARIAAHVQRGNGLWIVLGSRTQESFLKDVLAKSPLLPAAIKNSHAAGPQERIGVDIREPTNPMVSLLVAAERNSMAGMAIRQWWPLTPAGPEMRTILATTKGDATDSSGERGGEDPLVTEMDLGGNGGRVVVWATSIDGRWNNLPLAPNFVPLVNETLFHLAGGLSKGQQRQLEAGQTLLWTGPAQQPVESVKITLPDGQSRSLTAQLRGNQYVFSFSDTNMPGLYELRFSPRTIPQPVYYSASIDRRELDPAVISTAEAQWLRERNDLQDRLTPASLPAALVARHTGTELWPLLAFLVLALLISEVFLTRRLVRLQTDIHPEDAGLLPHAHRPTPGLPGGAR